MACDRTPDLGQMFDLDHPGAQDPQYRERRNFIASVARSFDATDPHAAIPYIDYSDEENGVWAHAFSKLLEKHQRYACLQYLKARRLLDFPSERIPQLGEVSDQLKLLTGFRLVPVEGLLDPRIFLSALADRMMYSTQYIRHASRPDYTPEPDVIHELLGHAPLFADPNFVAFTELIGKAAILATEEQMEWLNRLYWFTVEFGLIRGKQGDVKIFGGGLLSSFGEMDHCMTDTVEKRPFSIEEVIETPYDYSHMQPLLFVIKSFEALVSEMSDFMRHFGA